MIGSIEGKVHVKKEGYFIIGVNGVGYKVLVPTSVYAHCQVEDEVSLKTHLYVREDTLTLYGFEEDAELRFFELLLTISGIGPKLALSVLSSHSVEELQRAIAKGQPDLFQSISGIGKKNAQRIIVDLQPKIGVLEELAFAEDEEAEELLEALKSLGYGVKEARKALKEVDATLSEEKRLKEALRLLSK